MTLHLHKDGQPIRGLDDWFRLAPPKRHERHWKDGRSAKEVARSFVGEGAPGVPEELRALLGSASVLGAVEMTEASPEEKIVLDDYPGETRNADLAGVGVGRTGTIAFTIEAKADEEFGQTISERLADVRDAPSNVPLRIRWLTHAVLGRSPDAAGQLRYQLLHGAAASLILASERAAAAAVFIVHEFRSSACSASKLDRNKADLDHFVMLLGGSEIRPGALQGPFVVPGGGRVQAGVPLFIGKAVRILRESTWQPA
jgi:hypothetical protein